jgi:hypothetical protein
VSTVPQIPYGYRRVVGQLQKGDGLWDGTRFRRVRKGYPYIGLLQGVAVRKCEVVQQQIPATVPDSELEWVETP